MNHHNDKPFILEQQQQPSPSSLVLEEGEQQQQHYELPNVAFTSSPTNSYANRRGGNNEYFYIGMGTKNRVFTHLQDPNSNKSNLLDPKTDKILVNNIFKIDELESSWEKVKIATGIKLDLTYRNKSKDIKIDVSENCKLLIKELYKEDYYFLQKINYKNIF